jgi:hypothetical protein
MSDFLKRVKGYKSIAFFILAFVVVVAGIAAPEDLKIAEDQSDWIALAVSMGGLLLRLVTNTPVFNSEPLQQTKFGRK